MLITTTPTIDGRQIKEYLGVVTGTDIYLVGGLIGGGLSNQEGLYSFAVSRAISHMEEKARLRGADAIVGVSTNFTSPGNLNYMIVVVTGTAVLTDVAYMAQQKKQQELIDQENAKRAEEQRAAEELQQAFTNLGDKSQLDVFLDQASSFTRVADVKKLWSSLTWEDNPLITVIEKKISEQASFERIYGSSSKTIPNLLSNIRALMDGSISENDF